MTADMAHELAPHGVTAVSLYPGLVRTEAVLAAGVFDLSNSESPKFIGRAVARSRPTATSRGATARSSSPPRSPMSTAWQMSTDAGRSR
jgi:NAD(P)-dependent dehydrogenase (short-subunit alcohol dehydrogenase family)